jgi:hypothetical protein
LGPGGVWVFWGGGGGGGHGPRGSCEPSTPQGDLEASAAVAPQGRVRGVCGPRASHGPVHTRGAFVSSCQRPCPAAPANGAAQLRQQAALLSATHARPPRHGHPTRRLTWLVAAQLDVIANFLHHRVLWPLEALVKGGCGGRGGGLGVRLHRRHKDERCGGERAAGGHHRGCSVLPWNDRVVARIRPTRRACWRGGASDVVKRGRRVATVG